MSKMVKSFVFIVFLLISQNSYSVYSMRKCTLLPITDDVNGALGIEVYKNLEAYLYKNKWCKFESISPMLSIFSKYKNNLRAYLSDPKVINLVAKKLQVGSIVKVDLQNRADGTHIQTQVIGDNGEDLYFEDKVVSQAESSKDISAVIENWLNVYSAEIPYHGRVGGVLGKQITVQSTAGVFSRGDIVILKRPTGIKKHPLLKKVISWKVKVLAEGKVIKVSDTQVLIVIENYYDGNQIRVNDWVSVSEDAKLAEKSMSDDDFFKNDKFGQLGIGKALVVFNSASDSNNFNGQSGEISGVMLGAEIGADLWLSREYFLQFEYAFSLGSQKAKSSGLSNDEYSVTNSTRKLAAGYKYLPMGFFWGPQFDIYIGYSWFTSDVDLTQSDGLGTYETSGPIFGLRVDAPLLRQVRGYVSIEVLFLGSAGDIDQLYQSADSISQISLELGGKYFLRKNLAFDGSFELFSSKTNFNGPNKEFSAKENKLKFGLNYIF